ncbi:hypothetical protein CCAX7_18640 [Capsulimonas corticalis]|uniref:Uncharacterized protein n=1 Tax=Capsulimonas corticalis TaxID=2219043 RepID=A0A402D5H9_9BACT|nr:hypothetical protein [Capsulimonas corticalis]BDI29813.1 hypothetical protein CCAX7_18640 [Capsulimonas corticalis]
MYAIAACALLAVTARKIVAPTQYQSAGEIIQAEGQFVFTDGSSGYVFQRGGAFHSVPLSMSGREITGTWSNEGGLMVVKGTWGWFNGLSGINDVRRMKLEIFGPFEVDAHPPRFSWIAQPAKIYRCYCVVDELVRTPGIAPAVDKTPKAFTDVPKSDRAYECLRDLHDCGVLKDAPDSLFLSRGGVATRWNFAQITAETLRAIGAAPARPHTAPTPSPLLTPDAAKNMNAPNPLASLSVLTEEFSSELTQGFAVDIPAARRRLKLLASKTGE